MLTKEQKIENLKKALDSELTPEHIKEQMRLFLTQLEKPEPLPEPLPEPPKKKRGNPNWIKGMSKPKPKPPKPPIRILTTADKEIMLSKYQKRRNRKKQNIF